MAQVVNAQQLRAFLAATIPAGLPILITGMPGVGKTDITRLAALDANADFIVTHPVVEDPTDRKGIPVPDLKNGVCQWLTDETTNKLCSAKRRTVWLMDDLGQATPMVQAEHMQWLLNRGVNGHRLSDHVTIIACTNRRSDRAGVGGILEPVKSRFAAIVELQADFDSWNLWALGKVPDMLRAYLGYRPAMLANFQPTADLTNSPLPRTWANVAKLEALKLPAELEAIAFAGAVGDGAATEYIAFRKMAQSLVNLNAILTDPMGAPIPTKPDQLYATAVGLASRASVKTVKAILTYCERLVNAKPSKAEFAALCVRDAQHRDPSIKLTDSFRDLVVLGSLGKLISGSEA